MALNNDIYKFIGTILVKQKEKKKTEFIKLYIENTETEIVKLFYGFNDEKVEVRYTNSMFTNCKHIIYISCLHTIFHFLYTHIF